MIERIEINLLPAEYRVHRKKFQIKREVAYPLIIAGIVGLSLAFVYIGLQNSVRMHRNEIGALQASIEQNRPIQKEINRLQNDKRIIQEKIRGLELIDVNRERWVRLMEELANRLPEYTWLISVKEEMSKPPAIHIEGRTFSFPEVANFMSNLKDCPYISSIDLSQIEQFSPQERIFRFLLSCAINDNAYLTVSGRKAGSGGRAQ
ncbi:MAG: PilN domain-containing protein [Chitinispirillaceae bacterium]|nr:PilN domain-containing protein [Chitinispirillaceae bacterium]